MHSSLVTVAMPWLIGLGLAVIAAVIARGFWLYWASLTWPTTDGVITRIDIERKYSGGSPSGHYFSARFTYDFRDPSGCRVSGNWYKDFQPKKKREPLRIGNCPSARKLSLDSIRRIPNPAVWNVIRGLTGGTDRPVLRSKGLHVAARLQPTQLGPCRRNCIAFSHLSLIFWFESGVPSRLNGGCLCLEFFSRMTALACETHFAIS